MNVCFVLLRAGWGSDRHQHPEGHSRNLLRHPLRQDQTVPGRVTRQTSQRFATVSHFSSCSFFHLSVHMRDWTNRTGEQHTDKGLE